MRQAKLKYEWPVETVTSGADGSREKKRRASSRPDDIDSKSWNKLQYPTRLKIAEDERLRREREAGETFADGSEGRYLRRGSCGSSRACE